MKKESKFEAVPTWDEIENRVVESFNLDDIGANYAVSHWRDHVEKTRGVEASGEVAYGFTSTKVLDAVVEFFKADIAENMAIFQVRLARNDRIMKLMNLRVALGAAQGVFVDEEGGERIVPELLAVLRMTKSAKAKMLQQVVKASLTLANNNEGENTEQPSWPTGLGDGIQGFVTDLTEFIAANGDEGREVITHVCQDIGFAKKVQNNEEMPRPIRFLAQIVVESHGENHLPKKERQIELGFACR